MLLIGRGLARIRDATILSYIEVAPTIHQAVGVYMHWVILGMKLEYQALGYINRLNYKITYSWIYTQQNTVPGTPRIK